MAFTIGAAYTIGFVGYCYLLMPGGKVLRDRKDAAMTPARRVMRRVVPFMGLAIPLIISRDILDNSNAKYR